MTCSSSGPCSPTCISSRRARPGFSSTLDYVDSQRRYAARPAAVVLTHGHFDHVGSLEALLEAWDVPIYAHPLERPYLTGVSPYPPPDPLVGGGMMAFASK